MRSSGLSLQISWRQAGRYSGPSPQRQPSYSTSTAVPEIQEAHVIAGSETPHLERPHGTGSPVDPVAVR
jgi:hypothetical protein